MTIAKYPQSCLTIAKDDRALLIDPGTLATAKYKVKDFGKFEAVIYTHSHPDHLDVDIVDELIGTGATLYGNQDVAAAVGGGRVEVIDDGEELVVAGFKLKACRMEHCLMVDGSKGVPNTGFMVDDRILLPGDSTEDVGISAEVVALPIFGPDISYHDAFDLAKTVGAKVAVPVHFDVAGIDPESFVRLGGKYHPEAEIKIIPNGESAEV